jgi:hypothetical protein
MHREGPSQEEEKVRRAYYRNWTSLFVLLLLVAGLGACATKADIGPQKVEALAAQADTPVPPTDVPSQSIAVAAPAAAVAAQAPPSAQTILETALEKLEGMDSWQVEASLQITAEVRSLTLMVPVLYTGHFSAPDRLEGTVSTQILGVTRKRDVTILANTVKVADPGVAGATANVTPTTMFTMLDFLGLKPGNLTTLELVGQETLDGIPVYHLRGKVNTEQLDIVQQEVNLKLRGEMTFDAWIGVEDGLFQVVAAKGGLIGKGSQEGSFHINGTASFLNYGQPVTAEAAGYLVAAASRTSCTAAGQGFALYRDEPEAISFCTPAQWIVDELVDPCGYYAVSSTGVAPKAAIPQSLVVVYPDATVTRFIGSAAGAGEVFSRSGLCFFKYAITHALDQGLGTLNLGFLGGDPLTVMVSGLQYGDAKAAALSGMTDEAAYISTIEKIVLSIAPGKAAGR